jgi:DNA polymerase III delta subunit
MAKPVYALVGADGLLQQEALAGIVREIGTDVQKVDVDGETAELADVLDELRSFAMFGGGGRVVAVRNGDEFVSRFREQLEDYVAKPSDSATLVLRLESLPSNQRIYKAISKTGEIVACQAPKDLKGWIVRRGQSNHKLMINAEAAELLADLIGDDLGRIDNELAKLALGSTNSRISAEDIGQSVAFQREREMWDLTNALGEGDPAEAVRRWRQLVSGDSSAEFRAVAWLCIWLENVRKALGMIKNGDNAFTIGQALRVWPRDVQQKFVETVKLLGDEGRKRAVDMLAEVDYQSKTGVGDAVGNVERFLLGLAGGTRVPARRDAAK